MAGPFADAQLRKYVVSYAGDSVLARDRFVNTVHLGYTLTSVIDEAGDAQAILDVFQTHIFDDVREAKVSAYEIGGSPPHFPAAEVVEHVGSAPVSNTPREVALCLSYYGDRNIPRQRGRIYIPNCVLQGSAALRPTQTVANRLLDLADALSGIGGADVNWVVYSPTSGEATQIKHAWVDDEWDTMRSRGLRSTTRWTRDVSG